jgi:outer membrane lipase/esterase
MLGQYAVSVLEGPRQIAMLPQSAAMVGRSRADRVASHVAGKPESDGMSWWGGLRGDSQYQDDLYDGLAPAGTFGVDWSRGNLVFGGFAGYGSGEQDFDNDSGGFEQADGTLGGFAGWYGERAWVNGQVSYTWLGFDVDREVHLGPATRKHSGSPDGSNLSAGISAGFEFGEGALRHGPVASLLSQQVKVDGYAENNASSTALAYPDQDFDSLIGSAGWQASYVINEHLRPYARLTYDREFEKAPGEAFAQLQSLPGVMPYAVPGLELDRDYGTMLVGARAQVFGRDADIGLSATVEQKGGSNVTAFATFSGNF